MFLSFRYVEEFVSCELTSLLAQKIRPAVEHAQKAILQRIKSLIPQDKTNLFVDIVPRWMPLDLGHVIVGRGVFAGFQPDLSFKPAKTPSGSDPSH